MNEAVTQPQPTQHVLAVEEKYPTLEKLSQCVEERNLLCDFLEYLESKGHLHNLYKSFETTAHEFLGIDNKLLERERQQMLSEFQNRFNERL